jgi:3-hydroxy-9,10-secoandrosta-1,3,5(10)-triene-9,17-dione monooxygenase
MRDDCRYDSNIPGSNDRPRRYRVSRAELAPPEPGLTAARVIARARELIPAVRAQADEAELAGHHTAELDRRFAAAGLYRMLQPRQFGGYEFTVPEFWQAMIAISTGDPGTGWGLTLGAHHALPVGARFSERAQREIFGPAGDFRGPHRPPPLGRAEPAAGGYVVSGTWDYCSGITYATHFLGNAMVRRDGAAGGPVRNSPDNITAVIPADQLTVLDDWGGGAMLGMNASGSNSVRAEGAFVPEHWTVPGDWTRLSAPCPGAELHGNPMYCGRIWALYHAGLVIPLIGAARAALEELREILLTKKTNLPPPAPRYTDADHQRGYGQALALTDSAEGLVLHVGQRYMDLSADWVAGRRPFTGEDDARLYAMVQQAGQLAVGTMQVIFAAAGSSAARRGQRLQRCWRDVSMYHGHFAAQYLSTAGGVARMHFGLADSLW